MSETLQTWLDNPPLGFYDRVKIGADLRDRYFAKADDAGYRAFLP